MIQSCQVCKHLRVHREMSEQGFGRCKLGDSWKFWPLQHTCAKWQQESAVKLEKRIAWLRKRGIERN